MRWPPSSAPLPPSHARLPGSALAVALLACLRWTREPRRCCKISLIVFAQARWLERYPHATASITHGFPWRTFLDDASTGLEALPSEVFAPFETGRCFLEVSFPVRLGDVFEYPYKEHAQRPFFLCLLPLPESCLARS